ncbi:hypothetical protein CLNEO_12260 [Anaerotignum neopropionicum]|uniref:Uncharacterized protein n=1 Tax=Anaerotignum neopropionicum TaxID=36847 RepID=A0A136WFH2_9FIRM|nr:hypothetical protein [Anaerotignum neopropionicum]KXL53255.1 hypothetical protein CLNEO_12260 [Anaerotignum neopropionicum]
MIKTLKEFLNEVGGLSYDNGDYMIIKDKHKENEVKGFVDCFLAGTEILSNGKNGKPLTLKGAANTDKGATGEEELEFTGYQLYDYSDSDGNWYLVTIPSLEKLEEYLLSEAGFLNFYSTQMFVFENGELKPFEIMFNGDNDTVVAIDKDSLDAPLDIPGLQGRIWVRWRAPEELKPLSDADIAAYKKSIGK